MRPLMDALAAGAAVLRLNGTTPLLFQLDSGISE